MLPQQKIKRAVISTSIAALFLILTALIAFYAGTGVLHTFCFAFHLIPFGIAYGGSSEVYSILYYIPLSNYLSCALYLSKSDSKAAGALNVLIRERNRY